MDKQRRTRHIQLMITVHHLNESRSQRILWLLEELGLPYDIKSYQRDANTRQAPPALAAVHPLGKSPVITDDHGTLIESGAIIDHLCRVHGAGRLMPKGDAPDYAKWTEWLHYAEGSAMLPLMLRLYTARLGDAAASLAPRIDSEIANHIGYVDASLAGRDWLLGEFTSADVQMSFVGEVAGRYGLFENYFENYPHLAAWVQRFQSRVAYRRALDRGGPYSFAAG
jgi:glutathione S-transferase